MDFPCGHEQPRKSGLSCGCDQRVFVQEQLFDGRFAHFLFVAPGVAPERWGRQMRADVEGLIEQVVTGLGYELVDIEFSPKGRLLRVFLDIERGITVDDCATVSNQLQRVFEVENVDYDRLEVSSPGLDRPLKKLADFERFAGEQAQIRLSLPIGNQRNFVGVIERVQDGAVALRTEKGEVLLPFEDIEKARLAPQF
jgi:ribosome maturation factor RimP